jgi:hypothetical protein
MDAHDAPPTFRPDGSSVLIRGTLSGADVD